MGDYFDDYAAWQDTKYSGNEWNSKTWNGVGWPTDEARNSGITFHTSWCHNCLCNTQTYWENYDGYIVKWCDECGKRKWHW